MMLFQLSSALIIIITAAALPRPSIAEGFAGSLVPTFIHQRIINRSQLGNSDCCHDVVPAAKLKCHHETKPLKMSSSEPITSLWGSPPYLALLTEPDACASIERVEETIHAIDQATMDGGVNLVVVRVSDIPGDDASVLKWALLKNLAEMKLKRKFVLVVNDDVDIVLKALSQNITVDGVHVKEYNAHMIPSIRSKLEHAVTCSFDSSGNSERNNIVIGTSCHSIESAKKSYRLSPRGPDYLFVGTCYLTQSHPEKQSVDQLEGPSLPGTVKQELYQIFNSNNEGEEDGVSFDTTETILPSQSTSTLPSPLPPIIFAIGGIDEQNCHEPVVSYGADGVATIRTVMQASDPTEVVLSMKSNMKEEYN